MAWIGPYLLATIAGIGVNVAVPQLLDLAPAEARTLGVGWLAAIVSGVVAIAGTVAIDRWLETVLPNRYAAGVRIPWLWHGAGARGSSCSPSA